MQSARLLFLILLLGFPPGLLKAQPFPKGSVADNFTLKNRRTGEDVALQDFAGQVVVLDFFAYWCAPCAFSSPDIEENIQRYYKERGGNPQGVPVQVIAVNIERENPELTDQFIEDTDLELVVDDPDAVAWDLFNETQGIPLFAVINGVERSPGLEQWEVLHNAPSYPGAEFLRNIIDGLEAGAPPPDPIETALELGDGWRWIDWFGSFQAGQLPWIFHEEHGWIYVGEGNLDLGQSLFDSTLGWIWTGREVYPHLFSFERNAWLQYEEGSLQPRVFLDRKSGQTLEFRNVNSLNPTFNGFNLANTTIPLEEILSGGPPRDGIPAISDPKFLPINQVDYMEEGDILTAVTLNGETRGYPFRILNWHEITNDRIGDDHFVVTYCPLCGTAIVFEAEVNGIVRNFGVSGMLFQNNLLMYDRGSESLWSQFMLQSVSGPMQKTRLKWKFSEQMTWETFKNRYPDGKLLSTDTGFNRRYDVDPYAAYFASDGPLFRTKNPVRDDLPEKEWVWGITVGEVAKAYPLDRLEDGQPIRDTVNGLQLELVLDAAARSVAVTVVETGEPLDNGEGSFWFSWQDFFRETLVFE